MPLLFGTRRPQNPRDTQYGQDSAEASVPLLNPYRLWDKMSITFYFARDRIPSERNPDNLLHIRPTEAALK